MKVGVLVFPGITATDYVAPADLLARMPGAELQLVWKDEAPLHTELGWPIRATRSFAAPERYDMLVVPGGPGIGALLGDDEVLSFLAAQGARASWLVGICTGSLVLGAAGLMEGYRATCHWASHHLLAQVGAEPVDERVVVDRNRITGAGVTSGIDCALAVIGLAATPQVARRIQLLAEYDPRPPHDSGSPHKADPSLVADVHAALGPMLEQRARALADCRARRRARES